MQNVDIVAIKQCSLVESFTLSLTDLIPYDGATRFHRNGFRDFIGMDPVFPIRVSESIFVEILHWDPHRNAKDFQKR